MKYGVRQVDHELKYQHAFIVHDSGMTVAAFRVDAYGMDEARRRAEAEAKWLNERAEKFHVIRIPCESSAEYRVVHKATGHTTAKLCGDYMTDDLARAEAERLCRILNERVASK